MTGPSALCHGWSLIHHSSHHIRSRLVSVPTEVETEGVAYSVNARSQLAWARTIKERTAGLDALAELVHEAQIGLRPGIGDLDRSESAMIGSQQESR